MLDLKSDQNKGSDEYVSQLDVFDIIHSQMFNPSPSCPRKNDTRANATLSVILCPQNMLLHISYLSFFSKYLMRAAWTLLLLLLLLFVIGVRWRKLGMVWCNTIDRRNVVSIKGLLFLNACTE